MKGGSLIATTVPSSPFDHAYGFDVNALIQIDKCCRLDKTSLTFKREVSTDEWMAVFKALKTVEDYVQFWLGDCLAYRERKWGMYEDVAEETGYDKGTLKNLKSVSESIESSRRHDDLSFTHHQEVASLPPKKQEEFLKKAADEKLSVRELREEIKKYKRGDDKRQTQEFPDGQYQVIYADPPWSYDDTCEDGAIQSGGADKQYPTMSLEQICELPVGKLSQENAVLFIWVTSPLLENVFKVINAWSFSYKASFVWDKVKHNMGHYNSVRHEFLLLATRGSCTPDNLKLFDSVQSIERTKHSEKPEKFYDIIEALYSGTKIELFGRKPRKNWDRWGNE